jgi:hypothetical protein
MSAPSNQHIEIDGGVLRAQITTIRDISSSYRTAVQSVASPLPAEAFGALAAGVLVPAANALAGRSRELLAAAHDLSERMATGVEDSLQGFTTVEQSAVDTFSRSDG